MPFIHLVYYTRNYNGGMSNEWKDCKIQSNKKKTFEGIFGMLMWKCTPTIPFILLFIILYRNEK